MLQSHYRTLLLNVFQDILVVLLFDAVDSPKLCVFAAAECCQEPVAGSFPRPSDVAANFQGLSVDVVDPQVPSVADDADSPIYSALAAAVAGC